MTSAQSLWGWLVGWRTPRRWSSSRLAKTSLGDPSATGCPSSRIRTRSARRPTSPVLCSAMTTVEDWRCRRSRVESTWRAPTMSRLEVGSSRIKMRGAMARTAAMARRCFSPSERVFSRRPRRRSNPAAFRAASTRRATLSGGRPRLRGPKATSSSTRRQKSWVAGFWKTIPTWPARSGRGCSWVSSPSTTTLPSIRAGEVLGMRPARARNSVLLPEPEGPVTSTNSPVWMERESSPRTRRLP